MENGDDDGREGRVCGRCARAWLLVERGGSATQGCSPSTQPVQHVPGCSFQRGGERRGTCDSGQARRGCRYRQQEGPSSGAFHAGRVLGALYLPTVNPMTMPECSAVEGGAADSAGGSCG